MKKECGRKKRIVSIVMAVALVISVFAPAATVKAAGTPSVYSKQTSVLEQKSKTDWIWIENFPAGAQVTNLKSSNTKVLKASWNSNDGELVMLRLRKAGKAVVSFNVVYNGQTTSLKSTITVKKYQRPCATFKVGSKNYSSKFKKNSYYMTSHKNTPKNKVTVKAAKGWRLDGIWYSKLDGTDDKRIKNNSRVRFSAKKGQEVMIYAGFINKKTKEYQTVILVSKRKK